MEDYLVKALAFNGQVRAYAVRSTKLVGEAQRRHYTWPTASAAFRKSNDCNCHDGGHVNG